jgi:hypothetical protein
MRSLQKRATVYSDCQHHRALRIKATETDQPTSKIVNDPVRLSVTEDAEDLAAFEERAREPNLSFKTALKDLGRRGKTQDRSHFRSAS